MAKTSSPFFVPTSRREPPVAVKAIAVALVSSIVLTAPGTRGWAVETANSTPKANNAVSLVTAADGSANRFVSNGTTDKNVPAVTATSKVAPDNNYAQAVPQSGSFAWQVTQALMSLAAQFGSLGSKPLVGARGMLETAAHSASIGRRDIDVQYRGSGQGAMNNGQLGSPAQNATDRAVETLVGETEEQYRQRINTFVADYSTKVSERARLNHAMNSTAMEFNRRFIGDLNKANVADQTQRQAASLEDMGANAQAPEASLNSINALVASSNSKGSKESNDQSLDGTVKADMKSAADLWESQSLVEQKTTEAIKELDLTINQKAEQFQKNVIEIGTLKHQSELAQASGDLALRRAYAGNLEKIRKLEEENDKITKLLDGNPDAARPSDRKGLRGVRAELQEQNKQANINLRKIEVNYLDLWAARSDASSYGFKDPRTDDDVKKRIAKKLQEDRDKVKFDHVSGSANHGVGKVLGVGLALITGAALVVAGAPVLLVIAGAAVAAGAGMMIGGLADANASGFGENLSNNKADMEAMANPEFRAKMLEYEALADKARLAGQDETQHLMSLYQGSRVGWKATQEVISAKRVALASRASILAIRLELEQAKTDKVNGIQRLRSLIEKLGGPQMSKNIFESNLALAAEKIVKIESQNLAGKTGQYLKSNFDARKQFAAQFKELQGASESAKAKVREYQTHAYKATEKGDRASAALARTHDFQIFGDGNLLDPAKAASNIATWGTAQEVAGSSYADYSKRLNNTFGGIYQKAWAIPTALSAGWDRKGSFPDRFNSAVQGGVEATISTAFAAALDTTHALVGSLAYGASSVVPDRWGSEYLRFWATGEMGNTLAFQTAAESNALDLTRKYWGISKDSELVPTYNQELRSQFGTSSVYLNHILQESFTQIRQSGGDVSNAGDVMGQTDLTQGPMRLGAIGAEQILNGDVWSGATKMAGATVVVAAKTTADMLALNGFNAMIRTTEGFLPKTAVNGLEWGLVKLPGYQFGLHVAEDMSHFGEGLVAWADGDNQKAGRLMGASFVDFAGTAIGAGAAGNFSRAYEAAGSAAELGYLARARAFTGELASLPSAVLQETAKLGAQGALGVVGGGFGVIGGGLLMERGALNYQGRSSVEILAQLTSGVRPEEVRLSPPSFIEWVSGSHVNATAMARNFISVGNYDAQLAQAIGNLNLGGSRELQLLNGLASENGFEIGGQKVGFSDPVRTLADRALFSHLSDSFSVDQLSLLSQGKTVTTDDRYTVHGDNLVGSSLSDALARAIVKADSNYSVNGLIHDGFSGREGEVAGAQIPARESRPDGAVAADTNLTSDMLARSLVRQLAMDGKLTREVVGDLLTDDMPSTVRESVARAILDGHGMVAERTKGEGTDRGVVAQARDLIRQSISDEADRLSKLDVNKGVGPAELELRVARQMAETASKNGELGLANHIESIAADLRLTMAEEAVKGDRSAGVSVLSARDFVFAEAGLPDFRQNPAKESLKLQHAEKEAELAAARAEKVAADARLGLLKDPGNLVNARVREAYAKAAVAEIKSGIAKRKGLTDEAELQSATANAYRAGAKLDEARVHPETMSWRQLFGLKSETLVRAEKAYALASERVGVEKGIAERAADVGALEKVMRQFRDTQKNELQASRKLDELNTAEAELDYLKAKRDLLKGKESNAKTDALEANVEQKGEIAIKAREVQEAREVRRAEPQVGERATRIADEIDRLSKAQTLSAAEQARLGALKEQALQLLDRRPAMSEKDFDESLKGRQSTDLTAEDVQSLKKSAETLAQTLRDIMGERRSLIEKQVSLAEMELLAAEAVGARRSALGKEVATLRSQVDGLAKSVIEKEVAHGSTLMEARNATVSQLEASIKAAEDSNVKDQKVRFNNHDYSVKDAKDLLDVLKLEQKLMSDALGGKRIGTVSDSLRRAQASGREMLSLLDKSRDLSEKRDTLKLDSRPEAQREYKATDAYQKMVESELSTLKKLNELPTNDEEGRAKVQEEANTAAQHFLDSVSGYQDLYWKAFGRRGTPDWTNKRESAQVKAELANRIDALGGRRDEIVNAIFGHSKLSETEAFVFAELLARDVLFGNGKGFKVDQVRMITNNLTGNIVEVAMGGGKTAALTAVFGIRALSGNGNMNGHLVVADKKEISKYVDRGTSDRYLEFMESMGLQVADGNKLYEAGKDKHGPDQYQGLIKQLETEGNTVTVFGLDSYGHLARARKEDAALSKAWNPDTVGVDEADVAALMRKSFNVGKPTEASDVEKRQVLDLYKEVRDARKVDLRNFDHDKEEIAWAVDRQGNVVYTDMLLNKVLAIKGAEGKSAYTAHDITEIFRAIEDYQTDKLKVIDGEVHKSSLQEGFQYQTRDQSSFYQIAAVYESKTATRETNGTIFRRDINEKELLGLKIGLTDHGSEATVSEAFTRVGDRKMLVFGGSGTLEGAQEIARTVYGADKVVSVKEARYEDFPFSARAMSKSTYEDVASQASNAWEAKDANGQSLVRQNEFGQTIRLGTGEPRGFLGLFKTKEMLESTMEEFFKQQIRQRAGSSAQSEIEALNALFAKSRASNNLGRLGLSEVSSVDGRRGQSFLDLARSAEATSLIRQIANRVQVIDEFTDPLAMEKIAAETSGIRYDTERNVEVRGEPMATFAIERASRALNFKWEVNLAIVGEYDRATLLQALGRTGRTAKVTQDLFTQDRLDATNDEKTEFRYNTERVVYTDVEALRSNAAVVDRLVTYLNGKEQPNKEIAAIRDDLARLNEDLSKEKFEKALHQAVIQNANFELLQAKSAAASFRLSSEVVTKLAKEPLGWLRRAANADDAKILDGVYDKLRGGRYNNSRNIYKEGDFKSSSDIARDMFESGLRQAENMWRDLATNDKLSPELRREAAARLADIVRTRGQVGTIFQEAKGEAPRDTQEGLTFAKIDPTKTGIAAEVADVAKVLGRNLLPSESSTSGVQEQRVVVEARGLKNRIDRSGDGSVSDSEIRSLARLAQQAVAAQPRMQNVFVQRLAMAASTDIASLRTILNSGFETAANNGAAARLGPLQWMGATSVGSFVRTAVFDYEDSRRMGIGVGGSVVRALVQPFERDLSAVRQNSLLALGIQKNPTDPLLAQMGIQQAWSDRTSMLEVLNDHMIQKSAEAEALRVRAAGHSEKEAQEKSAAIVKSLTALRDLALAVPVNSVNDGFRVERENRPGSPVVVTITKETDAAKAAVAGFAAVDAGGAVYFVIKETKDLADGKAEQLRDWITGVVQRVKSDHPVYVSVGPAAADRVDPKATTPEKVVVPMIERSVTQQIEDAVTGIMGRRAGVLDQVKPALETFRTLRTTSGLEEGTPDKADFEGLAARMTAEPEHPENMARARAWARLIEPAVNAMEGFTDAQKELVKGLAGDEESANQAMAKFLGLPSEGRAPVLSRVDVPANLTPVQFAIDHVTKSFESLPKVFSKDLQAKIRSEWAALVASRQFAKPADVLAAGRELVEKLLPKVKGAGRKPFTVFIASTLPAVSLPAHAKLLSSFTDAFNARLAGLIPQGAASHVQYVLVPAADYSDTARQALQFWANQKGVTVMDLPAFEERSQQAITKIEDLLPSSEYAKGRDAYLSTSQTRSLISPSVRLLSILFTSSLAGTVNMLAMLYSAAPTLKTAFTQLINGEKPDLSGLTQNNRKGGFTPLTRLGLIALGSVAIFHVTAAAAPVAVVAAAGWYAKALLISTVLGQSSAAVTLLDYAIGAQKYLQGKSAIEAEKSAGRPSPMALRLRRVLPVVGGLFVVTGVMHGAESTAGAVANVAFSGGTGMLLAGALAGLAWWSRHAIIRAAKAVPDFLWAA